MIFDQAIRLKPDFLDASSTAASASPTRRFRSAISNLDRAIQIDPASLRAFTLRGAAYARLEQHDKAITDFTSALMLRPTNRICCWPARPATPSSAIRPRRLRTGTKRSRSNPTSPFAYVAGLGTYHALGKHEQGFADRPRRSSSTPSFRRPGAPAQRLLPHWKLRGGHAGSRRGDPAESGYQEAIDVLAKAKERYAEQAAMAAIALPRQPRSHLRCRTRRDHGVFPPGGLPRPGVLARCAGLATVFPLSAF